MAIHPTLSPGASWSPRPRRPRPQENANLTPQQAIEISAWTEQASESLENLHLSNVRNQDEPSSPSPARRSSPAVLTIPLDGDHHRVDRTPTPLRSKNARIAEVEAHVQETARVVYRRHEPLRRDSLKRREELQMGKEGSRRRQRWENDRLLSNPWAQQPSAADWQIQPTYNRHSTVPYYLAPLWDAHYAAKEQARLSRRKGHARSEIDGTPGADTHPIPKELRMRLKHARAAKGLLQDLEEEIRSFVQKWSEKQMVEASKAEERKREVEDAGSTEDDEDEVVFVGRKHAKPSAEPRSPTASANEDDGQKLVFESSADDHGAGFGRWLVHSLASYYGLRTWSVTVGNPPRREAYVGIDPISERQRQHYISSIEMSTGHPVRPGDILPRPLWVSI